MLQLHAGDRVRYRAQWGQIRTARIMMPAAFPGGYVGNAGGRYGTPVIISEQNFVSLVRRD